MPQRRKFSREVKLAAVERMLAGEKVAALAKELGVVQKLLYHWRAKYLSGGAAALRSPGQHPRTAAVGPPREPADLAQARARIVELERKVGQQELELDFFRKALRQVGEKRQPSDGPGASSSTRQSRR
ncbi:transposase [Mesorhizobium sp. VK22B]|uniref:Transposase n=1 Tax=Mesorhizobium captivum TaxID=3072319 RepID=A0ABU4ZBX6_9HYPH|nr:MULTISPECIES: transposase [unclassified Mesorhizobium]MDX8496751.1 transposase [Mesorhizobium sp. VK22B]MDX8510220.1 transposase [Mesorhizobium sp. VK22E]